MVDGLGPSHASAEKKECNKDSRRSVIWRLAIVPHVLSPEDSCGAELFCDFDGCMTFRHSFLQFGYQFCNLAQLPPRRVVVVGVHVTHQADEKAKHQVRRYHYEKHRAAECLPNFRLGAVTTALIMVNRSLRWCAVNIRGRGRCSSSSSLAHHELSRCGEAKIAHEAQGHREQDDCDPQLPVLRHDVLIR